MTLLEGLVYEGKTKRVFQDEHPSYYIIENKEDITAHDDPAFTQRFATKAKYATATTCRVFELLRDAGLPVAYDRQLSETTFRVHACRMISLECIGRRYGDGSFLLRRPDVAAGTRFHKLEVEFFLKTTRGVLQKFDGSKVELNLKNGEGKTIDDPLISNIGGSVWNLRHPKLPASHDGSDLKVVVIRDNILPPGVTIADLEELVRKTFLVLEGAWQQLGYRLIDFKIEFGIDKDGKLRVADVIDNDSWRLRTRDNKEVSKQIFRDGQPLSKVEEKYGLVAQMVERFRIPKQVLVLWTGSDKDQLPAVPEVPGIMSWSIACSAHKSPARTLRKLEELLGNYPDGGVIVALVGMSNGLGPILSARTSWPVIGVPARFKDRPEDIWSNLELPSAVPMATVANPNNAVLAALNILAQRNPAAYAHVQLNIENLDD